MTRQRPTALLLDISGVPHSPELVAFVRELRAAGHPVALATAGVAEPPAGPGLAEAATALVDSAAPDAPKPSADFFAAACRAVGAPAERCLFVDGDERSVRGARAAGLSAYRWSGAGDLPYLRAALGL